MPATLTDVSCVAHIHTTYSDGTATVPELLAAARDAGADVVLLTDHDSLAARRDGWEGAHDGVFLLVGTEVSSRSGHYLAFGIDEDIVHDGLSGQQIATAVRAAGGIGFAAHPFSVGGQMLVPAVARRIARPYAWTALDDGCDGVELWCVTTDAAEGWRTPAAAWRWLRDPVGAVAEGPPRHHLQRWDELSRRRRVPAVGGLDGHAHGPRIRGRVRSPMSHARTFDLLRTHLLCDRPLGGDTAEDSATLLRALREGAAWLACHVVAPADGARLWAELADGTTVPMGGEAPAGRAVLRVRLPRPADVLVLRDGAPLQRSEAAQVDVDLDGPGVFRVEARIGGRLWLLSNPVHLR